MAKRGRKQKGEQAPPKLTLEEAVKKVYGEIPRFRWFDDMFYPIKSTLEETLGQTIYLPSVTSILNASPKPWLPRWRGDVGNERADQITREAMDRGQRVHQACYVLMRGGNVIFKPNQGGIFSYRELSDMEATAPFVTLFEQEEYWMVYKFGLWLNALKPEILYNEMTVYDELFGCAGTLDLLMKIPEGHDDIEPGHYIVDLKTGKDVGDEAYMQVSAYAELLRRTFIRENISLQDEVKGAIVLHLNAKTKTGIEGLATHLRNREEMSDDLGVFMATHLVWKRKNMGGAPTVRELPALINLNVLTEEHAGEEAKQVKTKKKRGKKA